MVFLCSGLDLAGLTTAQAETMLAEALINLSATRLSEEYKIGSTIVRRSMLSAANEDVSFWNSEVIRLSRTRSGHRVRRLIPKS